MSSLVASIGLAIAVHTSGPGDLNEQEQRVWKRVEPSIVTLYQGKQARGAAALIDDSGLFLAHKTAMSGEAMDGRMSDGKFLRMVLKATDEPTQFVLLQAQDWTPGTGKSLVVGKEPAESKTLIAVLANGPIRAMVADTGRIGVVSPKRRMMPLNEMRFEAPENELVGGALVFNGDGNLVGALSATLVESFQQGRIAQSRGFTTDAGLQGINPRVLDKGRFGPAEMTTAYTIAPKMLQRVVSGFLSPGHVVEHPTIGLFCRDSGIGGALVDTVVENSPAHKAGIKKGDIIISMGTSQIKNQFDFAKFLLDREVGEKITMALQRGSGKIYLEVIVGRASD